MTLQHHNSENMNKHLFSPLLSPAAPSVDFESDLDDPESDAWSVWSADSRQQNEALHIHDHLPPSVASADDSADTESVLSEEEYRDLHARLDLNALSHEWYDDRPDWLETASLRRHGTDELELTIDAADRR